jgi:hypothetical protein
LLEKRAFLLVLSCGGLTNLSGAGHAPGISALEDAIPVLDERTRQLIASLVEASVQSALAAARNGPSGDEGGVAEHVATRKPR